ncbi:unnamed protein product [Cunninghamella blakesleeana]
MSDNKKYYYAVHKGYKVGVFNTWAECQKQIKGFKQAKFRKFPTKQEAEVFAKTGTFTNNTTTTHKFTESSNNTYKNKYNNSSDSNNQSNKRKHENEEDSGESPLSKRLATSKGDVIVYTDGASSHNGRKHATAGYGVYWGDGDDRNVSLPLEGERQTNQRAEAMAIIKALEQSKDMKETLEIRTDSQYCIKAITEWSINWIKNDWKTASGKPVQNMDLFKRMIQLKNNRVAETFFVYVPGHKGFHGNEMADQLAVLGASKHNL